MRATHLIHRHLPGLELRALDLLAQLADHKRPAERVLLRKASRIDGFEACEESACLFDLSLVELRRVVTETVVVALVSESRCKLGFRAKLVFPLFVEE